MNSDSVMENRAKDWTTAEDVSSQNTITSNDISTRNELKQLKYELKCKCEVLKNQQKIINRTQDCVNDLIERKWQIERSLTPVKIIQPTHTPKRHQAKKKIFTISDILNAAKGGTLMQLVKEEM